MAGFTSFDQLIAALSNGQTNQTVFNKTVQTSATSVAGRFHEALSPTSSFGGMALTGPAGVGIVMNAATSGALPYGSNVEGSSMRRYLQSIALNTPTATLANSWVILTDIIHIYPSITLAGGASALSNHPSWVGAADTRMNNSVGVQASVVLTTASTAAGSISMNYKDQSGNDQAQNGSLYSTIAAQPIGSLLAAAGAVSTLGGPYMQIATPDTGIQQINSYAIGANITTGVGCIILHRPICSVPIAGVNTVGERDFTTGPIRLPRIYDDACLGMFVQIGGAMVANANIVGELNFVYN